jgi:hypothetical protein
MNPEAASFVPSPPSPHNHSQGPSSFPPGDKKMKKSKSSKPNSSSADSLVGGSQQRRNQRPNSKQQASRGNDGVHLLNFQYPQTPPPKGSGGGAVTGARQRKNSSHGPKLKAEYSKPTTTRHSNQSYLSSRSLLAPPPPLCVLIANLIPSFKFVLRDSVSGSAEPWLLDPDIPVPWSDVLAVIALEPSTRNEGRSMSPPSLPIDLPYQDDLCPCPICLDSPSLPVMTRCGHVYCVSCLLRYLEQEFNKKCPMCSLSICRSDLKEIFSPPFPLPRSVPNSSSSFNPNPVASFSLLLRLTGSLFPYRASALVACPDPVQLLCSLPSYRSVEMLYSGGLCGASPTDLTALWTNRLDEISRYRDTCLASASLLSSIEESKKLTKTNLVRQEKKSRGWEQKESSSTPPPSVPTEDSVAGAVVQTKPIGSCPEGDVEYLPFLPEAEDLIRQKLAQLAAPKSSSIPSASAAPRVFGDHSKSSLRKEDLVYSYQLSLSLPTEASSSAAAAASGLLQSFVPPSFLHPLCVRCLLSDLQAQSEEQDSSSSSALATLLSLPHEISGKILEVTVETVTETARKRYPFLRHLPLDSLYRLVEIDMSDCLTPETFERYPPPPPPPLL